MIANSDHGRPNLVTKRTLIRDGKSIFFCLFVYYRNIA